MTDRDILPDNFKPGHYDLVIKDLDFEKWSYTGTVRYAQRRGVCASVLTAAGSMASSSSPRPRSCSTRWS